MSHLEKFFAALYVSEGWYVRFSEDIHASQPYKLYARTRAVVLFDRVITDRFAPKQKDVDKEFREILRTEDYMQGSWI